MRFFDKRESMDNFEEYYQDTLNFMKNEIQMIRPRRWVALEEIWDENATVADLQFLRKPNRHPNLGMRALARDATFPSSWEQFEKLTVAETCPVLLAHVKELESVKTTLQLERAPNDKIIPVEHLIKDFQIIIKLIEIRGAIENCSGKRLSECQKHFGVIQEVLKKLLVIKNTRTPNKDFFDDIFEELSRKWEENFFRVLKNHVKNLLTEINVDMNNIQPMDVLVGAFFAQDKGPGIVKEYAEVHTRSFRKKIAELAETFTFFDSIGHEKLLSDEVPVYRKYLPGLQKLILNYGALAELPDFESADEAIKFLRKQYANQDHFPAGLVSALKIRVTSASEEEPSLKKHKGMLNQ